MLTFFEVLTAKAGAPDDIDPATDDVDVLLHIEIDTTAVAQANEHITALGYQLREPADHADELGRLAGSDRKRIRHLADALSDPRDPAWLGLDEPYRTAGQAIHRSFACERVKALSLLV